MNHHQITTTNLHDHIGCKALLLCDDHKQEITIRGLEQGRIVGYDDTTHSLVYVYVGAKGVKLLANQ